MTATYRRLQIFAIAISVLSVVYNSAEGAVSIAFGVESASRSLVFFGIQSGVEVASALIVLWRFRNVAKPGEERTSQLDPRHLQFEKYATLAIGTLLILLALATIATAISVLVLHQEPDTSNASLIISLASLFLMILIYLPKRYLARALNSSTMQGEATCSLSCIQITLVLFVGSLVYRVWKGGWWVDGVTSIALGILFGWEGIKMWKWAASEDFDGGCCGSCRVDLPEEVRVEAGKGCGEKGGCCSTSIAEAPQGKEAKGCEEKCEVKDHCFQDTPLEEAKAHGEDGDCCTSKGLCNDSQSPVEPSITPNCCTTGEEGHCDSHVITAPLQDDPSCCCCSK
ncbi:hypothetical protein JAAARDRAFT_32261 [Jaapia argillacea MUCL 33604]|uniref:Cation efflux protein transmembrane domain-containing protein n=1 Tax=Jaapia argillacea MUCL 33604 TaxID=933084 RepID=A0A067Q2Q3_9AGAM|nr:hypothetical protein JAAARDRAFT_32261 [Jaapia argillacea MUCL 33604]